MPRPNKGPQVKQRKDTGLWGVCEYVRGNRHWHVSGLSSQQEAQEELAYIILQRRTGASRTNQITVGEVLAYYLDNHIPHTARPQRGLTYHDILSPFWPSLNVSDVNKANCQKYCQIRKESFLEKTGKEISNDSLRAEIEHLVAALNYAHDNDLIEKTPKAWKPAKALARQRWLTKKEAAALLIEARKNKAQHLPLFIILALYTGARAGAILSLRWPQVDLKNDVIDYRPSQQSKIKGYAVVPIPPKLKRELLKARKRGVEMGYVLHVNQDPIKSVKTSFGTCCKKLGLNDVTPNTLRHTHASWLKQKGLPSAYVAENMGHTTPDMVDRTYGHMGKAYMEIVKNAF